GALCVHLGAKWATMRVALGRAATSRDATLVRQRRAFLTGVAGTGALVFLATAGNTIRPLSRLAALAQRRPGVGPQGPPVNQSAHGGGVGAHALEPEYRLTVVAADGTTVQLALSLAELQQMPSRTAELPI